MIQLIAMGECMVELAHLDDETLTLGFAGDSSNAMVYLKRQAPELDVTYLSALGDDNYSQKILEFWRRAGINTDHILSLPGELPGLSIIQNQSDGERSFYYWRGQSAYRKLIPSLTPPFDFTAFDYVYITGITLGATPVEHHETLREWIGAAKRNGSTIIFDPNYRSRLWDSAEQAWEAMLPFVSMADWFLTSDEDLAALQQRRDPVELARTLIDKGCSEVVIRRGSEPCELFTESHRYQVDAVNAAPVDTTGAGDSFNGTYLACRISGLEPKEAAARAHQVAAKVVTYKGAIIPEKVNDEDI